MELMVLGKNEKLGIDNDRLELEDFADKLLEETVELVNAIHKFKTGKGSRGDIAEEALDNIQVCIGVLNRLYIDGADIKQEIHRNNKKLINRWWKPKAVIRIQVQRRD